MKEEIKEILNNVDSDTKFKMVDEDGTEKEMNIAGLIEQLLNDNRNLLDYITNLQEENERLKEELQQEKKDFKEANDYCFELKDYKSRIDKAIEYIKNHKETREYYEPYGTPMGNSNYTTTHIFGYYELLDILQGEDINVKDKR